MPEEGWEQGGSSGRWRRWALQAGGQGGPGAGGSSEGVARFQCSGDPAGHPEQKLMCVNFQLETQNPELEGVCAAV